MLLSAILVGKSSKSTQPKFYVCVVEIMGKIYTEENRTAETTDNAESTIDMKSKNCSAPIVLLFRLILLSSIHSLIPCPSLS